MNFAAILAARTAASTFADAEFIAWANTATTLAVSRIITYRDVYAVVGQVKTAAIAAVIKASNPIADGLMYGTGIDIQNADCQAMLTQISAATGGVVTADDVTALTALGQSTIPAPSAAWGGAIDATALSNAAAWSAANASAAALQTAFQAAFAGGNRTLNALRASLKAGNLVTVPTLANLWGG